MLFYALTPLVVRRSMTTLSSLFVAAVVVHFLPAYLGLPARPWQYEFFPTILVFFLAGALSYRPYLAVGKLQFDHRWGYLGWLVLGLYCVRFGNIGGPFTNALAPLALYLLAAVAIPFLFLASKDSKVDRFLGDLSYPLYVVHFAVICTVGQTYRSAMLVTGLSLVLCIGLVVLVERPIDTLRHKMSVQRWLDFFDYRRNKPIPMR